MSYFKKITSIMKRVLLVTIVMLTPVAVQAYCHNCGSVVSSGHSNPVYAPQWTIVEDEYGDPVEVEGRNIIRFVVKKDMTYRFTTAYGEQAGIEDYNEDFNPPDATIYCTEDSACSGYNMWCNKSRNECMPMGLKFDTELTLFKGGCCNPDDDHCDAEYLGYNNNALWQNQSMLEWKSDFDGEVFLLVTNNSCAESPEGIHTSVRWQRIDSSHCRECPYTGYKDDPDDYHICADGQPASETSPCDNWDSPLFAPDWLTIGGTNAIKAGDYQYYDVEKGKMYRWSTCTDPSFDTQLTLFRDGFECDNTDHDAIFLAYNDDYHNCASGYFQSTLEWKADFTGTVALLTSQYPCNYCKPGPEPDYSIKFNHCSWTTLDWQRSDCANCNNSLNTVGGADEPGIDPAVTSDVEHGDYIYFDLTEGAEYEFSTCVDFSGGSCDGTPGFDATLVLRTYDSDESCAGNVLEISRTSTDCPGGCRGATITYKAPEDMKVELLVAGDNCESTGGTVDLKWLATDSPEFRYVEEETDGDEYVADIYTLIWWYDPDEDPADWEDALDFCDTLEYAGRDDWRMPDFNELGSIVDFDLTDPATGLSPFPSYGKTDTDEYWTSTTNLAVDPTYAWGIDLSNGKSVRLHKEDDERKFLCIARAKVSGELIAEKPAKERVISGWACDAGVYKIPGGGTQNNAEEPVDIFFRVFDAYGDPIEFKDTGLNKDRHKYGETDYKPSELSGKLTSDEITEMTDKIDFNCDDTAEKTPHMYYYDLNEDPDGIIEKIEDYDPPYYITVYAANIKFGFIPVKTFKLLPEKEPFVLKDTCGDALVTGAEDCDDGNDVTEECDYGEMSCTVCDENCKWAAGKTKYCGDKETDEPWEECDEGDETVDICDEYDVGTCEVCDITCSYRTIPAPYCGDGRHDGPGGDGLTDGPEECDDGNDSNTDYCMNNCTLNECGNGHPNYADGQICDDGDKNGLYETECEDGRCCNETCDGYGPYCGDDNVDAGYEDCDDGDDNGLWRTYTDHLSDPGCNTKCDGPAPHCGDGKLQSSFEFCDDGAAENEDDAYGKCSTDCQKRPRCGDGIIDGPGGEGITDGPEICDDGAMNGHYGYCNSFCSGIAECGDGELQADHEECDWALVAGQPTPYAISKDNSCTEDCETGSYCGDEVVDYGSHGAEELCDDGDGNVSSGSYNTYEETCTTQCKWFNYCGDGKIDGSGGDGYTGGPEVCDDGINDGSYNGCNSNCESLGPYCGDNHLDSGYEDCDKGESNTDLPATYEACRKDCTQARCGDGITDEAAGEECDDGELNSNTVPGACRTDCTEPTCGDGVVDDGEECDDGNSNNNDSCTDECKIATCGDGFKKTSDSDLPGGVSQPPNEVCDKAFPGVGGGEGIGDYCKDDCQEVVGSCGDGTVQAVEACDNAMPGIGDGDGTGDYCSDNCKEEVGFCGDGKLQDKMEECDPGINDGIHCNDECKIVGECGDGTVQEDYEVCDNAEPGEGGGEGIGDYCSDDCQTDLGECGDGEIQYDAGESCDDGTANGTYKRETPGHCDDDCKGTGEGGYCGDSTTQDDYEICDEGGDNGKYGGYCNATCDGYTGECGDGTVQSAYEVCDDGENNGEYGYCNETCTGPAGFCGDGTVNSTKEACDSGLASGLMAYFPFNGDTLDESPIVDEESSLPFSKVQHNGSNYGATLTKDRKGATAKAYYFDGSNDYITLGDTDVEGVFEGGSTEFTVSAWIKPDSLGSTSSNHNVHNVFFAKASKSANDNLEIGVNPGGGIDVYVDTDGGNNTQTFHTGTIETGDWYFVAVTFDNGTVKVYINGNLIVQSASFSGSSIDGAPGAPVSIGGTLHTDVYFNGKIDEVRIFNRAVPEDQIGGLADWALDKTCNAQCQWNDYCGDGHNNGDEFCDSGGSNRDGWGLSKACNDTCTDWAPYCGDENVDSDETCDDGADNGTYGNCNSTCDGPGPRCGDGTVQSSAGEACDEGDSNRSPGYYDNKTCSTNCQWNDYCGDGTKNGGEVCDEGGSNSNAYGNNCKTDCSGYTGYCGDGIVQTSNEVCDGNTESRNCTYYEDCNCDKNGCDSCPVTGTQSRTCQSNCLNWSGWSTCN